jgi:surfeit locus 1 family protein
MRAGHWQFSPRLWPTIAVMILLPVLVSLGFWQLDRAEQKRMIHGQFLSRQSVPFIDLNFEKERRTDKNAMLWRNVKARGTFDGNLTILLDNQVMHGEAGYYVFTLFRLDDENVRLLVNRGWLPAGNDRNNPPPVSTPDTGVEIIATAKDVPVTGMRLDNKSAETMTDKIIRVPNIELDQIAGLAGQKLLPYVLRLRPESDHGYLREWHDPGSGEERHLGYAFQWFALAATLLVIYLVVNLKKAV